MQTDNICQKLFIYFRAVTDAHLRACNVYADDTLVYCNGSTMSELKHNIQQYVSDIHEWYDENKLVIHMSKSSVMFANTRQRILHIDNNDVDVHIGDYRLVQTIVLIIFV